MSGRLAGYLAAAAKDEADAAERLEVAIAAGRADAASAALAAQIDARAVLRVVLELADAPTEVQH